jgi:hypothetical protein
MLITKSRFVAGAQCLKRLYLAVHSPELAMQPDESDQSIIDQGREVGLLARQMFHPLALLLRRAFVTINSLSSIACLPKVTGASLASFMQARRTRRQLYDRESMYVVNSSRGTV